MFLKTCRIKFNTKTPHKLRYLERFSKNKIWRLKVWSDLSSLKLWILPINSIEVILRSSHWRRSAKIYKVYSCICVQNLRKISVKEFNFSKVADLKPATLMENWTPLQVFLSDFSTVAEPTFCRATPSVCLCALLEKKKRIKEMK